MIFHFLELKLNHIAKSVHVSELPYSDNVIDASDTVVNHHISAWLLARAWWREKLFVGRKTNTIPEAVCRPSEHYPSISQWTNSTPKIGFPGLP